MKKLETVEQQPRYQLKKLSIGLVSTLAGMSLMLTNPVMVQAADEADAGLTDSDVTTAPTTEPYKPVTNATTTPVPGATEAVSEATWNLTGLGNAQFGTVNYTADDQTLTVTGNGRQPQSAFGSALYNTVTVTRNDQTVYRHDYYGNQGVKFNDHVAVVPADVITIFQSEPNRIKVTPTTLKATGLASPKTFAYQVQTDGKLVNLTDYLAIVQNLQSLFADTEQTKLRFGLSPNDLAQVTKTVAENPTLNPEQRQQLQAVVAKAEQLLKQRPAGVAIGTSVTLPIFSVAPNATTNKEGRTMANTMDRQALGITMDEGATIRVKVTSDQSKVKTVTLDLIDSSSQNEQLVNLSVNGDWVTVTAAADQVPYLKTPNSGDYQLTYEVVGGRVDQLPIFTYGMNETKVEQQWDQTKAPYALFKSYNMQLQIPYADLLRVVATDMNSLLSQYDDQVFKLYGELTGIPYNTSDTPIIRRYFGMADKNGIGAAYYHPSKWIAINGASVGSYLLIGWLTLHEIAHGYELPSSTMSIIDNFNNVYGTIYQAKYTYPDVATFNQKSWLYGGNRDKVITQVVDEVLNQHQTFNQIGLRDRLLLLLSLADYRTTDSWRVFNQYHRDVANAGKPANDLGKMWVESFEQAYQVDATPFFQTIGVPIDPVTQSNVISTGAKALTTLRQVVPENQLAPVMQQLGWSKDVLKTPLSLVTTDELASTGLTGTTNLTVHQAQLAAGKQILVKNGSQVVRTLTVPTDTTADFTTTLRDLPIGIYTLVSEDPQVSIDQPYLYVTASQVNDATISLGDELLNELKALYTDQTLTKLKPTVTAKQIETVQNLIEQFNNPAVKAVNQALITRAHNLLEQVNLTGAGYGIFATINDNNGDGSLTLQTYPVEPHWGFGAAKYATITIYDQANQIVYERTFIANQVPEAATLTLPNAEGYRIELTHQEKARLQADLPGTILEPGKLQTLIVKDGHLELLNPKLSLTNQAMITLQPGQVTSDAELLALLTPQITSTKPIQPVKIVGTVDFNQPGTYQLTLQVTDGTNTVTSPATVMIVAPVVTEVPKDYPTFDLPAAPIPAITAVPKDYPTVDLPTAPVPGITEVPKDYPTVNLPTAPVPGITEVPKDYPTVDLPTAPVPGITEVPKDYPTFDLPAAPVPGITAVPKDYPTVDLPAASVPGITAVPKDYPTVDLPEASIPAITAVPKDYPTVDLPEASIPAITAVPKDYPTVDLPAASIPAITAVPKDYPTVDLPAAPIPAITAVPKDYPTVDLPAAPVPVITAVPKDYPTVDLPAAPVPAITAVPKDYPTVDLPAVPVPAITAVPKDYPTVDLPAAPIPVITVVPKDYPTVSPLPELSLPSTDEDASQSIAATPNTPTTVVVNNDPTNNQQIEKSGSSMVADAISMNQSIAKNKTSHQLLVKDDKAPVAAPVAKQAHLPQTGHSESTMLSFLGIVMMMLGITWKRKLKH